MSTKLTLLPCEIVDIIYEYDGRIKKQYYWCIYELQCMNYSIILDNAILHKENYFIEYAIEHINSVYYKNTRCLKTWNTNYGLLRN